MRHLPFSELESATCAIEDPPACRVQHPVTNVGTLQALGRHECLGHLCKHCWPDPSHVLRQDDAGSASGIVESHRVQMLGSEEGPVRDNPRPVTLPAQSNCARTIRKKGVCD